MDSMTIFKVAQCSNASEVTQQTKKLESATKKFDSAVSDLRKCYEDKSQICNYDNVDRTKPFMTYGFLD